MTRLYCAPYYYYLVIVVVVSFLLCGDAVVAQEERWATTTTTQLLRQRAGGEDEQHDGRNLQTLVGDYLFLPLREYTTVTETGGEGLCCRDDDGDYYDNTCALSDCSQTWRREKVCRHLGYSHFCTRWFYCGFLWLDVCCADTFCLPL